MSSPTTPEAAILAAYVWAAGACYRCQAEGEQTAIVGRLPTKPSATEVRACLNCVLGLEREREQAAHRYGRPYVPGEQSP
jgi:hypothetical protein